MKNSNFDSRDVERICKENYDRRKMREEAYEEQLQEEQKAAVERSGGSLRSLVLSCAVIAGGGAAFTGMGVAVGNGMAVFLGVCTAAAFVMFGVIMECFREKGGDR
jgi:hypothetical protein